MEAQTSLVILNTKDIQNIYGFSRDETYRILNSKGCPLIFGGRGKRYKVEKKAFEEFLMNRRR